MRKAYRSLVLLTAALVMGLFASCQSKPTASDENSDSESEGLFDVEIPECEKFVWIGDDGIHIFQDAYAGSPELMVAMEDIESDMADIYFCWSSVKKIDGYRIEPFHLSYGDVVPVLDDDGEWIKIHISNEWIGDIDAYITKGSANETKPEPITEEVLRKTAKGSTRQDRLIDEGNLKGLCITTSLGWMDEPEFSIGELRDGVLIYPETKSIYTQYVYGTEKVDIEEYEESYMIKYGDKHLNEEVQNVNLDCLDDQLIEDIYKKIKMKQPSYVKLYYYFPSVHKDKLVPFTYKL